MEEQSPRAILLGMLRLERKLSPDAIAELATVRDLRRRRSRRRARADRGCGSRRCAPPWIAGDYPQWLDFHLARMFDEDRAAEGAALASRAPSICAINGSRESARAPRRRSPSPSRADTMVALRAAHRARGRAKNPADPCRAGLHQGHDRGAGRRLATRGTADGCKTRRAGDRSLRRRRRQDTRACNDHATTGGKSTQRTWTNGGWPPSMHGWSAPAFITCK